MTKRVPPHEVIVIRDRVRQEGISDGRLAEILGCSRSHINQIFNGAVPMRLVYRYAIMMVIIDLRRNRGK